MTTQALIDADAAVWTLVALAEEAGAVRDEGDDGQFWTLSVPAFHALKEALVRSTSGTKGELLDTLAAASKRLRLGVSGPLTADALDAYAETMRGNATVDEAMVRDALRWRAHIAGRHDANSSHVCRACSHRYTPALGDSEDCPLCGNDGTNEEPSHIQFGVTS